MTDMNRQRAWMMMEMQLSFGLRRPLFVLRPEAGSLPEPLERAANAMHDAQSDDEARAAAREFLVLSEEWVDRPPKS